jgi:hypothetical protein
MSLELINTFGTLLTVAIIAATAIAAIIQLRHMRAGNQINAVLTIGENYYGREFMDAAYLMYRELPERSGGSRIFEISKRQFEEVPGHQSSAPELLEVRKAALLVCNTHDELGVLVKRGAVDKAMFLESRSSMILNQWARLENFVAFRREVEKNDSAWENFELLAVWSEDWTQRHVSSYPNGVRRWRLHNPWPVPPMPATP